MRFQKQVSATIALLILSMSILLPVAEGEESRKEVPMNGSPNDQYRGRVNNPINVLGDLSSIKVNKQTWALTDMPDGTFSGAFVPENIFEYDWQTKHAQNRGYQTVLVNNGVKAQSDFHGFLVDSNTGLQVPSAGSNQVPVSSLSEANYDNSVNDPYGMDDMGFGSVPGDPAYCQTNAGTIDADCASNSEYQSERTTNSIHYGPDSYHTYFSIGVTAQFTHQQIMAGASEFWIRSPIDGFYNPQTSFISIFEVPSLSDNEFEINLLNTPTAMTNDTGPWATMWSECSAPEGRVFDHCFELPLDRPTTASVPSGNLVYDAMLADSDAIMNDYSELGFYYVDNNSGPYGSPPSTGPPEIVSGFHEAAFGTNCDEFGALSPQGSNTLLHSNYMPLIPCNIWPGNNFKVAPAASSQTQQISSFMHTPNLNLSDLPEWMDRYPDGIPRTYHRANTFLYPNQPYLFVFYLEILQDDPIFAVTQENIFGPEQESYIVKGHYNYSNPDINGDGRADYSHLPNVHYNEVDLWKADGGLSIIFTQGQSQDMAGYRFKADNTTISFIKKLPEPVQHENGPDDKWGIIVDGPDATYDDELDYVSLYMPFINHNNTPLTIEYVAFAFAETELGMKYRPWYMAYPFPPGWSCWSDVPCGADSIGGMTSAPQYNFYYSGFDYDGKNVTDRCFGCNTDLITNNMRAQPLNDVMQDPDFHANDHRNYYLHTSELVPANGTTHILYVMKIAGHHHWQANIENSRFYSNEDDARDRQGENLGGYFFDKNLDKDNDGRTDSTQQNTTDITLLISKPVGVPSDIPLALPIFPTGVGGIAGEPYNCYAPSPTEICKNWLQSIPGDAIPLRTSCETAFYGAPCGNWMWAPSSTADEHSSMFFPNAYNAPANGWTIYQEEWDRDGYRVDGAYVQSLFGMQGQDSACAYNSLSGVRSFTHYNINLFCDMGDNPDEGQGIEGVPSLMYQSIQGISWHQAKNAHYASTTEALGNDRWAFMPNHGFGIFEINARGASYIMPQDYSRHNTELFTSVSLTNGRFTEVKNIDGNGFHFLDNAFPKRIIIEQNYEIYITAQTELVWNPSHDFDGDGQEEWYEQLAVDVYEGWNWMYDEYGDEFEMVVSALEWMGGGLVSGAQILWDGGLEGMTALFSDGLNKIWEQMGKLGTMLFQGMVYIFGEIFQLFAEWGIHLDEIAVGLLHVFMYVTAFWFVRFILKMTSTLILKFKGVELY